MWYKFLVEFLSFQVNIYFFTVIDNIELLNYTNLHIHDVKVMNFQNLIDQIMKIQNHIKIY